MDWDKRYQDGDVHWDRGGPSPPLRQYVERNPVRGRVLVPGCGRGHDVAMFAALGADAIGLDISPTAIRQAQEAYPDIADRFVVGDLFDAPQEFRSAFDVVAEHTCLSGLAPPLREYYRKGVETALKPGGLLVGVWFINPELDPGATGPPFGISVGELDTLFASGFAVVADFVPEVAYEGREGRERLRVLRKHP